MEVRVWGPPGNFSYAGIFNSALFARYAWSNLSDNLRSRLKNSSIDYLTSDKFIQKARTARSFEKPTDGASSDAEYVDVDSTLSKWDPEVLPLVKLDDPYVSDLVPRFVVDEALSELSINNNKSS